MSATCQCKDPVVVFAGAEMNTPFCRTCHNRVEVVPAYEPDPEKWQARKFVRKGQACGSSTVLDAVAQAAKDSRDMRAWPKTPDNSPRGKE